MVIIENTVISDEIFEIEFFCNLESCKGECCIEGDAGAPLEENEINQIEDELEAIKPYMRKAGLDAVEEKGIFEMDGPGEYVTPLVGREECAFVIFEKGIAFCAIEKAYEDGKVNLQKPISCFLYPIRITKKDGFEYLNYHKWQVCDPALKKGKKKGIPLYVFLKEPLIRRYGKEWYLQLEYAAKHHSSQKK